MGTKIYTAAERKQLESRERESHAKQKHAPPTEETKALVKLSDATRMLAEVRDAPSAKKVMDLASAAEHFAKKAKLGQDAIDYAFGIKLDAQRKLGEYLKQTPDAPRGVKPQLGTNEEPNSNAPTLAELGVSKKLSAESQRLAELPEDIYERVREREVKPSQAFREKKRADLPDKIASLPAGTFRVIYADPPWKYGDEREGIEKEGTAAAAQYPTMPTRDICDFVDEDGRHVRDLAQPDAVLFMWATFPLLEDGLEVIKAWGFHYKTAFVWDKQRSNIGNYHDARAELLMIATRGSCPIEIDTRPKQVQTIERGRHSAKPESFRELIDALYPTGPRLELFRRGDAPAGWTVWGNEAREAS